MEAAFALALVTTTVYFRTRNLWALGIFHGWFATGLYFPRPRTGSLDGGVPGGCGRDPFSPDADGMDVMPQVQTDDQQQGWLTLDNAARIYPAALSEWSPDVYRLSVTLKARIRVSALEAGSAHGLPQIPVFPGPSPPGSVLVLPAARRGDPRLASPQQRSGLGDARAAGSAHLLRVQARGRDDRRGLFPRADRRCRSRTLPRHPGHPVPASPGRPVARWDPFLDPGEPAAPGRVRGRLRAGSSTPACPGRPGLSAAYHLPDRPGRSTGSSPAACRS